MGCDIHAIWQAKKNGEWVDVESTWNQDRDYLLFGTLAEVRNRDNATYIAEPRGLPADFPIIDDEYHATTLKAMAPRRREFASSNRYWMGDHSYSWLTADEMLAFNREPVVQKGIISVQQLAEWDRTSRPESYCQEIGGPKVKVANSIGEVQPDTTDVWVTWVTGDRCDYFFKEVARLKELHGEVRLVFGFDS